MCKGKAAPMKNKQANTGEHQKDNQEVKSQAVPVPPTVLELSEEDLKHVTGGIGKKKPRVAERVVLTYSAVQFMYTEQEP
jgi:bacteriocin-like protein